MFRIVNKFRSILTRGQKIRILVIVVLMLVGGFLETVGVSLIVPLLTAMLKEDFFSTNRYAVLVCDIFGLQTQNTFMMFMLLSLIAIFIIKDAFLFFEYYVQTRFICNNRLASQERMMRVYMNRPYEFYLNSSTGEIMRVILSDVSGTFTLLTTVLSFFTEAIVSVALIIAIFVIDAVMAAITTAVLLVELGLIYVVIKPVMRNASLKLMKANSSANKWILQGLNGIKDVKVSTREEFFVDRYLYYARRGVSAEKRTTVFSNAPRLIIEAVTIAAMLGLVIIEMFMGKQIADLMPQLSAFGVAAVRLLPSTNRISTSLSMAASGEPFLDSMIKNLKTVDEMECSDRALEEEIAASAGKGTADSHNERPGLGENKKGGSEKTQPLTLNEKCELKDITYSYPGSDKNVLEGADMVIPVGSSVGIVGTSGAGKTTAVDILLGLLRPSAGEVLSDGRPVAGHRLEWLSHISYIPQQIFLLDDTIKANVAFGMSEKDADDEAVENAIREAMLYDFVKELPEGLNTTIGERGVRLSGGQRQRIGIARALYSNPSLLIFDEATSALDNETESAIMESINSLKGKKTMVIIAHRLSTIEECDIVYRVEGGKITRER